MDKNKNSDTIATNAETVQPGNKRGAKVLAALKRFFSLNAKLCILLSVVTLLVYANTLRNGYVMDDVSVIEKNTIVTKGLAGIPELMVTPRLKGFDKNIVNDNYRPLSLVMFAMEYQLFGPDAFEGHLFNILFFAGCVVVLFIFLNKLLNGKTGIAFIAALLFAVHPIHTEVVANIKSRDELMCFFFAFWSLILFINYAQRGRARQLIAGTVLLSLSILSKETVIAFLFVVPLVFFFYRNEHKRRGGIIFAATILVSLVFLVIRAAVLKGHDSSVIPFIDNPLVKAPVFSARIPTAIMVLGDYLRLLLVPYPLVCDYSFNSIPIVGFGNAGALISLAVYLLLAVTGIYRLIKKDKDPLAFGILFFFACMALFSNILVVVYSEMAERLVFFASAGFCLAIAVVLWGLFVKSGQQTQMVSGKTWFILAPVSAVFALLTINRNIQWETNYSLFSSGVKASPRNARLWHSLGYVLLSDVAEGEPDSAIKKQKIAEGVSDIQKALVIYPDNYKAHMDIGDYFRGVQQYDSAEYHLKEAVRIFPGSASLVSDLGYVYFCEQKFREALALSQNASLKDKQNTVILNNIAMCYLQLRKFDSAVIILNKALSIEPGNQLSAQYLSVANKWIEQLDSAKGK